MRLETDQLVKSLSRDQDPAELVQIQDLIGVSRPTFTFTTWPAIPLHLVLIASLSGDRPADLSLSLARSGIARASDGHPRRRYRIRSCRPRHHPRHPIPRPRKKTPHQINDCSQTLPNARYSPPPSGQIHTRLLPLTPPTPAVNAFDQLTRLAKSRRYRETAQALQAVKELTGFFKAYVNVDRVAAVSKGVHEVQGVLRAQVMRDFEEA